MKNETKINLTGSFEPSKEVEEFLEKEEFELNLENMLFCCEQMTQSLHTLLCKIPAAFEDDQELQQIINDNKIVASKLLHANFENLKKYF